MFRVRLEEVRYAVNFSFPMNKKGLTWETIIYAILALIVLVTVIWMFRTQIGAIFKSMSEIIQTTTIESEQVRKGIEGLANST